MLTVRYFLLRLLELGFPFVSPHRPPLHPYRSFPPQSSSHSFLSCVGFAAPFGFAASHKAVSLPRSRARSPSMPLTGHRRDFRAQTRPFFFPSLISRVMQAFLLISVAPTMVFFTGPPLYPCDLQSVVQRLRLNLRVFPTIRFEGIKPFRNPFL